MDESTELAFVELFGVTVPVGLITSVVLVLGLLALRAFLVRLLRGRQETLSPERRRWIALVKNGAIMLIVIGLIFIWSPELSALALSLTAVAVAIVIATKEMILCVVGAVMRATSDSFSVGDRIEVDGVHGEVVDHNLLTTSLQEIGTGDDPYAFTGRTVTLPNSRFVTHEVRNENFRRNYTFHSFRLAFDAAVDPTAVRTSLETATADACREFEAVARRYHDLIRRNTGVDLPGIAPQVRVSTTDLGKLVFTVTLFCPTNLAHELQQRISEQGLKTARASMPKGAAGTD